MELRLDPRAEQVDARRAILVAVARNGHEEREVRANLNELGMLARTAGVDVAGEVIQKRSRVDPAHYIGRGKVDEITNRARDGSAGLVIFDDDLSPAQVRNLERLTDCRVIDRSELILDIFALRARTRQARVQVELAQLEYLRPRLKRMWTHLERYEGGIGMRGPGEKQLEIDRRLIDKRIRDLKRELARVEKQRALERRGRARTFRVALVGYTNAGKSTLLNRLTGAAAYEADELFATLDTLTRAWDVPCGGPAVLSDTVGFLNKLPHHLISSFHATLGEAIEADLLLHVIDAASPRAMEQCDAVDRVLVEIGAETVPVLPVLNKCDSVPDRLALAELRVARPRAVEVSARTGYGIESLAAAVAVEMNRFTIKCEITVEVTCGRTQAFIRERAEVLAVRTEGNLMHFSVRITEPDLARLQSMDGVVVTA